METVGMKVFPRTPGKKYVKGARREGLIPINVYGKLLKENIVGSVERGKIVKALRSPKGHNVLVSLETEDGKAVLAIPYRIDINPVKNIIDHIDFMAIKEDEPITVQVPLLKKGRSQGEIVGGRVLQVISEVVVRCRPADIPESLMVDVTPYDIGDRVMVNDLPYPPGVTPMYRENVPAIVVNKGRGQMADEVAADGAAKPAEGAAAEAKPGEAAAAPAADKKGADDKKDAGKGDKGKKK
ncbi:MAG TPA: 50S ribosomal protein L25 [bacterium]|nr:50S ribosomal protein L25 [bacterium]